MYIIFVFSSVTAAKRVEKTIAKHGVLSQIIHTPKSLGKGGCSHSVRFNKKDLDVVTKVITNSDISLLGAYYEMITNGRAIYNALVL